MVVLASSTPPASRVRAAGGASATAGFSGSAAQPSGTAVPSVAIFSLIVSGTPSMGPAGSPFDQRASEAFAETRAASGS